MPELTTEEHLGLLIGAALLLLGALVWAWRRRARRSLPRRLRSVSVDALSNILIPTGDGGEIHVEHALLTHRGVIVIDIKDVQGNVFGSDSMQDWTVIAENRRYTFSNPQPALYDRLAAIMRLMPEVPVAGYIAFTNRARFTKGRPTSVMPLDALLDELQAEMTASRTKTIDAFYPYWKKLRDEAVATQVGQLLKD
ncbi:MAG: nuclease-related domain-containing protein [Gammaproteobacteria bacterium]